MANTTRQNADAGVDGAGNPVDGAGNPVDDAPMNPAMPLDAVKAWVQPTRYHQISATGRERGYFVRVPHLPVIDDIAAKYGPEMAQIWYRAALRQLTQLGQARGSAKDVAKDRASEQAAIEASFAAFADGSLRLRGDGDDDDDGIDGGMFNRLLREASKPTLESALAGAGHPTTDPYIDLAFGQYYNAMVDRFGPSIAAAGYVPVKKGAAKAEAGKVKLTLALPPA